MKYEIKINNKTYEVEVGRVLSDGGVATYRAPLPHAKQTANTATAAGRAPAQTIEARRAALQSE